MNPSRARIVAQGEDSGGPVVYWMSRDQRSRDNWALIHARELAGSNRALVVAFCLVPSYPGATLRHYDFMLKGLEQTAHDLREMNIPFALLMGDPAQELPALCEQIGAGLLVTDFDPLRIKGQWLKAVASRVDIPLLQVDAHNVVPAWVTSDKQEYAARTIRPKIHRLLPEYLEDFPELEPCAKSLELPGPDWTTARALLRVDEGVGPVALPSGESHGLHGLVTFLDERLLRYAEASNDPNADAVSKLSAYLHFGQLSAQRVALETARRARDENAENFLEQLVVRRELSDNFCLYNPQYETLAAAPEWAIKTLDDHRDDPRPYLYTLEQFERAETHSDLWNAAQMQMVSTGFMHGYMRMFWAKKILEWSISPEQAFMTALTLNDRYQLDGRDPNGYVGVLWSMAGIHDRPWKERPVYGKVRYMNENGCRRKFDVGAYIAKYG
ncbi:deoxyribodipyrimidine photo-lyase [Desulfovibrio ferrophilus]|nr:deoxyribodipyrimidine photo-lyase [Desulfovibrio ferrophilus]